MNLADQLTLENAIGRLHALECALQALILTHPDPSAFGEILDALSRSVEARPGRDGNDPHVRIRQGFRDGCGDFRRAAEVAVSTGPGGPHAAHANGNGHANGIGHGNGNGHAAAADGSGP